MMTVETVFNQLTDPKRVMTAVRELLRLADPGFAKEEEKYNKAAEELQDTIGNATNPTASEYLAAMEECYGYELLYICWQGFQYNLDCYNAPVNAMMLQGEFETLHRERRLHTLSSTQRSRKIINAFDNVLKEKDCLSLTNGITDFYITIETIGYKIAHYFGFLFADRFLPIVMPGYTPDSVITNTYSLLLSKHSDLNVFAIECEEMAACFRSAEDGQIIE